MSDLKIDLEDQRTQFKTVSMQQFAQNFLSSVKNVALIRTVKYGLI